MFAGTMRSARALFFAFMLAPLLGAAQDEALSVSDEQTWFALELEWRPIKRWRFTAEYTLRTYGAARDFKGSYYYLTVARKLGRHYHVDGKLRMVNTPGDDFFRSEVGFRWHKRIGKDLLYFRTAYFHEERKLFWEEGRPRIPDDFWRNRIRYMKDLPKRYSAYASFETWTRFRHDRTELRRVAFMTGLRRDLKGGRRVSLEYLYQPEFAKRAPRHLNAIILGFNWDVTKPKKRRAPGKRGLEEIREDRE